MQTLIKHRTTGALLFTALTTALGTASLNAQDVIVEAKKVVIAFGAGSAEATMLTDSALLIRDGKIALVGSDIPAETRASARVIDYGSATISPGFVLAATTLGRDAREALPQVVGVVHVQQRIHKPLSLKVAQVVEVAWAQSRACPWRVEASPAFCAPGLEAPLKGE